MGCEIAMFLVRHRRHFATGPFLLLWIVKNAKNIDKKSKAVI